MRNQSRKGLIRLGGTAVGLALMSGLAAGPVQAQDGRWCKNNPDRCARLKDRVRARCQQDPAWCARLRERMRQRRAARQRSGSSSARRVTLDHDGHTREFFWYTPGSVRRKAPLVVLLHGGGGRARQIARYTGFEGTAATHGFSLVIPQGLKRRWNDGRRNNRSVDTDDVGFLRKVVARVARLSGKVDLRRVYVTGISNGGHMTLRMACDASDLVAGAAAVTAQFSTVLKPRCRPSRPVPMLIMNGTKDTLIPYTGGPIAKRFGVRGYVEHTDATVAFWRQRNGCGSQGQVQALPDRDKTDGVTIVRSRWTACRTGAPVVLYKLIGGGHTWPGKRPYLPERIIGKTGQDIDGTVHIWRFFASLRPRR